MPQQPINPLTTKIITFFDEKHPFANVYPVDVFYGGTLYKSSEHAYHAQKFDLRMQSDIVEQIINATSPTEAKEIANYYENVQRPNWCTIRYRIMMEIVTAKFEQHSHLLEQLLAEDSYLVETSEDPEFIDDTWGMLYRSEILEGRNFMGRILMIVRKKLQAELGRVES